MVESFVGRAIDGAEFRDCSMAGSRFEDVNLSKASFSNVDLSGAEFDDINLADGTIGDAKIDGLTIHGQDIQALIAGKARRVDNDGSMVAEPQLFVSELAAAFGFYRDRLGFEVAFAFGAPPFYAQLRRGGWRLNPRRVAGPVFAEDFRDREADALSATLVARDIRPFHAEYERAGLAFHQPLRAEPWGALTFILRDPDDNLIAFAGDAPQA